MRFVSHNDWRRHASSTVAVDRLLDAAGAAFAEHGVAEASMLEIARRAGCSRATLYRYFPSREALHLAYVHRATLRIAAFIVPVEGGGGRAGMVDRIMAGIRAVRADPLLAVWFEPQNMAIPMAVSQDSELLRAMSAGMAGEFDEDESSDVELQRRGAWLLRCIVSFLALPGPSEAEERAALEAFVVPLIVSDPDHRRSKA